MNFSALSDTVSSLPDISAASGEAVCFQKLSELLAGLSAERRLLKEQEDRKEMTRFRETMLPVLAESTFCRYAYSKPRGYSGDYVTQEMIWNARTLGGKHRYSGTTRTGELLSSLTFDMEACCANEWRIRKVQELAHSAGHRIASMGSGSCIELWSGLDDRTPLDVVLVDQDEGALQRADSQIGKKPGWTVRYAQGNIVKYILSQNRDILGMRDFVYLAGLLDYFPLKSAGRLIQGAWNHVAPGGFLLATNCHPGNPTRLWMEYGGDWFLEYKDEGMMHDIANVLEGDKEISVSVDPYGVYIYLICRRRA